MKPQTAIRAERSSQRQAVVAFDKRHVWHPYTPMDSYIEEVDPLVIERAQGPFLYDMDGRNYLDANSSWWVAALGHNHPRLVQALKAQADTLCHCSLGGITHEPASYLAEELVAVAPSGLTRVFFSDNGSTAVEAAVKMAVQYWAQAGVPKRTRLVALEGAFHGETIGASSLGGIPVFRRPFAGLLFDCIRLTAPTAGTDDSQQAFSSLEAILERASDEVAAVVIEPLVQGVAGMRLYAPEYVQHLRAVCDRHDTLLIFDEVFAGYGRTGTFWAADQVGVRPDILCTAKGFTGGMLPMAATLVTERVFNGFRGDRGRAFYYGHSFCGNPLGAAVAREVLRVFKDEQVLCGIPERAKRIANAFEQLQELPGVTHARSLGMIGAVDITTRLFGSPSLPGAHPSLGYLAQVGWEIYDEARKRGAYLRPMGNVVYVAPPLNIPLNALDQLLAIVHESVQAVVLGASP